MKKKYLINDFLIKFPSETLKKKPKWQQIIITSNLNHKKFSNVFKNDSISSSTVELLKIYFIFSRIFGQTPFIIHANQSVANWNIGKGMNHGIFISLRNNYYIKFFLTILPLLTNLSFFSPNIPSFSHSSPLGWYLQPDLWTKKESVENVKKNGKKNKRKTSKTFNDITWWHQKMGKEFCNEKDSYTINFGLSSLNLFNAIFSFPINFSSSDESHLKSFHFFHSSSSFASSTYQPKFSLSCKNEDKTSDFGNPIQGKSAKSAHSNGMARDRAQKKKLTTTNQQIASHLKLEKYSEMINDLKSFLEWIGCRIYLKCQYDKSFLNKSEGFSDLLRRDFIFSYYKIPFQLKKNSIS